MLHDQSEPIAEKVRHYEDSFAAADLPNVAFHSEPLLNGRETYMHMGMEQFKRMLW